MKLVCPSCGLTASAEAWINDAAARDLLLAVVSLPAPLPKATLPYLGLFRPEKQSLRWDKAGKIVAEMAKEVGAGFVQVQGKVARPCPPRIWAVAMEQMVERRESIRRPLPNHNYLKQVAWQLADEADAKGEKMLRIKGRSSAVHGARDTGPSMACEASGGIGRDRLSPGGHNPESNSRIGLCPPSLNLSPMDAYIQGQREDKPAAEEMQEWSRGRLRG